MKGRRACIAWFIFLPQQPKFSITNASLSHFDVTDTNYNLELSITIRNPNKKVDIYYKGIQVIANYEEKEFAMFTLDSTPFYQGYKNTTTSDHVVLDGQRLLEFKESELSQFKAATAAAFISIHVQLALRVKLGYDMFKRRYYQQSGGKIDCKLKVPLSFNEKFAKPFKLPNV